MQKKWIAALGIATLINLANHSMICYGMDAKTPTNQLSYNIGHVLPQELRQTIHWLALKDTIRGVGRHPKTFTGHTESINSVAIQDDKVITASNDKTVKIWNIDLLPSVKVGKITCNDWVKSTIITDDKIAIHVLGKKLAIYMNNGPFLRTLDHATAVATSGDKIITGSWGNIAKIWDINTGELQGTLVGHAHNVRAIAASGNMVVTGSDDHAAKVWNITDSTLICTLEDHTGPVRSIAIDSNIVVTGSTDKTAKIWDITKDQPLLCTLEGHTSAIYAVAISGDIVATGSLDKTVKIWDRQSGKLLRTLTGHTGPVTALALTNNKVVTGSQDKTAKVWPLSLNLQGTPEDNPLVWMYKKADLPALDLIKRAYKATQAGDDFIIYCLSEDGKVFLTMPKDVRTYLLDRLNIQLKMEWHVVDMIDNMGQQLVKMDRQLEDNCLIQ